MLGWGATAVLQGSLSGECACRPPTRTPPHLSPGIVQVSNTRLLALRGPTSCHNGAALLPAALASQASHFKPTILMPDAGVPR